jgi:hypothetical protein
MVGHKGLGPQEDRISDRGNRKADQKRVGKRMTEEESKAQYGRIHYGRTR